MHKVSSHTVVQCAIFAQFETHNCGGGGGGVGLIGTHSSHKSRSQLWSSSNSRLWWVLFVLGKQPTNPLHKELCPPLQNIETCIANFFTFPKRKGGLESAKWRQILVIWFFYFVECSFFRIFLNAWEHYNGLRGTTWGTIFALVPILHASPPQPWTRTTCAVFNCSHRIIQEKRVCHFCYVDEKTSMGKWKEKKNNFKHCQTHNRPTVLTEINLKVASLVLLSKFGHRVV